MLAACTDCNEVTHVRNVESYMQLADQCAPCKATNCALQFHLMQTPRLRRRKSLQT